LIPFAKECKKERPNTIIQENNAPTHSHFYQQEMFDIHEVQRLLWPGNSPDLNMIEPAWPWMKRRTTVREAPRQKKTAEDSWYRAWSDLSQEKIQTWIERIPRHIQEVLQQKEGIDYREGRTGQETRSWKGQRIKGKLSAREDIGESDFEGEKGWNELVELLRSRNESRDTETEDEDEDENTE
jgi:hypothetical protein